MRVLTASIQNAAHETIALEPFYDDNLNQTRYIDIQHENITVIRLDRAQADPFIIPSDFGIVQVVFRAANLKPIKQSTLDMRKYSAKKSYSQKNQEQYHLIRSIVSEEMDNPSGTELERSEHTRLLRDATSSKKAEAYIKSRITNILLNHFHLKREKLEELVYRLYGDLYGLGVLQELDDDPEMGEIMVNAVEFPEFKCDIYYIKNGQKHKYDKTFDNLLDLQRAFNNTIRFEGVEMNRFENPRIEANRPSGDRVNIIIPDASDNWLMNIRKFTNFVPNLETMRRSGTVDDFIDPLMDIMVRGKANIGIGGEMGTGKTTFINYLLSYTEPMERKVVIASVSETDVDRVLAGHDVAIFNVNDKRGLTFSELLRTSLRTTASRVIIPESRGGEFKELYEANLKTKGNMFTAHAMDDESFMDMTVDMYMSSEDVNANESSEFIKNKITKALDLVIIMRKVGRTIRIKSISEVLQDDKGNYAGMNNLYEFEFDPDNPTVGQYVRTNNRLSEAFKKRLNEHGVLRKELAGF